MLYRIQVRIKVQTDVGEFNDALYFSKEEYEALTQSEIEIMKQARVDAWVNSVKNPPVYIEPTLEELKNLRIQYNEEVDRVMEKIKLQATKEELEEIKAEMESKIVELNGVIESKRVEIK